ncbi:MAG TPA: VOC family protein [Candidatus Binatia bacterium]|jgi:lactoylglutathione lyase|nr:VOC family protein [Candidatus Binatia bacterium]
MNLAAPNYVILIVEDLDRALKFYTGVLGLRLGHRSGDYAQFDTGVTRLGFYTRNAMAKTLGMALKQPAADSPSFEIGFKVEDVDAAFTELVQRGAAPVTLPTTRPWGQRTAYVRDPDGHLIELAQDLRRS